MSEHKGDELSATGSHRVWTGETAGSVVRAGAPRDPQRNWLDRSAAPARHTSAPGDADASRLNAIDSQIRLHEVASVVKPTLAYIPRPNASATPRDPTSTAAGYGRGSRSFFGFSKRKPSPGPKSG